MDDTDALGSVWVLDVSLATGADATHPKDEKSAWYGDNETANLCLLNGAYINEAIDMV